MGSTGCCDCGGVSVPNHSSLAAEAGMVRERGGGICRLRAHAWVSTGLPSAEAEAVLGLLGFWGGEPWLPG